MEPSGKLFHAEKENIICIAVTLLLFVFFRVNFLCTRLKTVGITCMTFSGPLFILLCLLLSMGWEDLISGILTMIRRY